MTTAMTKEHLDSSTDNPKSARGELATNVDNFNGMRSLLQGGAAGELLTGQGVGVDPAYVAAAAGGVSHIVNARHNYITSATGNGTEYRLSLWVEEQDDEELLNGEYFNVPESGQYLISFNATVHGGFPGYGFIIVRKNDLSLIYHVEHSFENPEFIDPYYYINWTTSRLYTLVAGDALTFSVQVFGGTRNYFLSASNTFLTICRVGD